MRELTNIEEQNQGAQGYIQKCVWNGKSVVMKLSNHIDFVLELEEEVWERLKIFNSIHFCRVLSRTPINPGERRYQLVFEEIAHYESKNSTSIRKTGPALPAARRAPVKKSKTKPFGSPSKIIVKNDSLGNLLYDAKHKVAALMNCLNQTLAAIIMYQNLGITHYDLHIDNVMITNTEYDIHVYKIGPYGRDRFGAQPKVAPPAPATLGSEAARPTGFAGGAAEQPKGRVVPANAAGGAEGSDLRTLHLDATPTYQDCIVAIKTFGISPVIIDFGMAYVPDSRYNATCMFANNGFTTFMPDHYVDARLLLVTAVKDLEYIVKDYKKNHGQAHPELYLGPHGALGSIPGPSAPGRRPFYGQRKGALRSNPGGRGEQRVPTGGTRRVQMEVIKTTELYIKKIKSIYGNLKIQENGWFFDNCFNNIINEIVNLMPKILINRRKGGIFKKNNLEWTFELMQHEIQLPLPAARRDPSGRPRVLQQSLSKAILLFASEWVCVEQVIRNTKEEQLFLKDIVSMDENLKSYITMRHRYPKIKNLKKLKSCCKIASEIFSQLLNNYKKKIEVKKSLMYSKIPQTRDILLSLPKQSIKYEKDMKVNFINTGLEQNGSPSSPSSPNSFNLIIDENMANRLNNNEQKTLYEIFQQHTNEIKSKN